MSMLKLGRNSLGSLSNQSEKHVYHARRDLTTKRSRYESKFLTSEKRRKHLSSMGESSKFDRSALTSEVKEGKEKMKSPF